MLVGTWLKEVSDSLMNCLCKRLCICLSLTSAISSTGAETPRVHAISQIHQSAHEGLLSAAQSPNQPLQSARRVLQVQSSAANSAVSDVAKNLFMQARAFQGERAIEKYTGVIALAPTWSEPLLERANCYVTLGEEELALKDFDRVLALDSKNTTGLTERASCNIVIGNFEKALADLNASICLDPLNARAYEVFGDLNCTRRNFTDARKYYSESLKIKPQAQVFKKRAAVSIALSINNTKSALQDYRSCIKCYSRDIDAYECIARLYEKNKDYAEAARVYSELIAVQPNRPDNYLHRANAYLKAEKYNEALLDANRLMALNPKDDDLLFLRAQIYDGQKNYKMALRDVNACIAVYSGERGYLLRAAIYEHLGQPGLAATDKAKAASLKARP